MTEHLGLKDRWTIEDMGPESRDLSFGVVGISVERCKGCGFCAAVCPAAVIEIVDKKARMVETLPMCMSCGDCTAVCPEEAIAITGFIAFHKYFRYLDRGKPEPPRIF